MNILLVRAHQSVNEASLSSGDNEDNITHHHKLSQRTMFEMMYEFEIMCFSHHPSCIGHV